MYPTSSIFAFIAKSPTRKSFITTPIFIIGARLLFGMTFIIVTYLSLTTGPQSNESGMAIMRWLASFFFSVPDYGDKIGHFLAYGALGFFAAGSQFLRIQKIWIILIGLTSYGVLMEYFQLLGGVRHPNIWDAMANASGAVCGMIGFFIFIMMITKLLSITHK